MATSKKYLSLEEAASILKIKTEELIRFREKGEIRGFADRGTWKFKAGDVEEFARRRQPDSDPDVGIIDDDFVATKPSSPKNAIEDEDDEVGSQATVIRKGRPTDSDSDVRFFGDSTKKGESHLASPTSEIQFNEGGDFGQSEIMPVDSVIHLADSEVLFADSEIQFTQSEVQLFGRGQQKDAEDSDIRLVNLFGGRPESDSDVKLVDQAKPRLKDSDSDVKLAKSDSDVKVVKTHDSDSDVQLIDHSKKRPSDSDSDVKLMLSDSDSDVKLIKQRAPASDTSSDSDVAILPSTGKNRGKSSDNDASGRASALYDDDPGITLPGDSGIQLSTESGIQLAGDSGIRLAGDSGIRLAGDSPVRLSGDSGIQLQQPADSGILLEGQDSGLTLDHRGDSGIRLSDDSGMKLLSGSSKNLNLKGGSSKNLKGRGPKPDSSLDLTAPMISTQDVHSDDELSSTAPMLLRDDDLSDDDLEVPLLSDDTAAETNVIMFEDDESDQTSATVVKKGRKSVEESAFDLEDMGEESVEDELEVSDDVLGEDDELEDLDAFASDEDEFDENFETGASRIGFGPAAAKIAAPLEVEWSTGVFISLIASCLVLLVGAIESADLLRTTWAAGDSSVYPGELLEMIGGFLK